MNADMFNRGTEDRPLSLFRGGGERPLRPPLDPPLVQASPNMIVKEQHHIVQETKEKLR